MFVISICAGGSVQRGSGGVRQVPQQIIQPGISRPSLADHRHTSCNDEDGDDDDEDGDDKEDGDDDLGGGGEDVNIVGDFAEVDRPTRHKPTRPTY